MAVRGSNSESRWSLLRRRHCTRLLYGRVITDSRAGRIGTVEIMGRGGSAGAHQIHPPETSTHFKSRETFKAVGPPCDCPTDGYPLPTEEAFSDVRACPYSPLLVPVVPAPPSALHTATLWPCDHRPPCRTHRTEGVVMLSLFGDS